MVVSRTVLCSVEVPVHDASRKKQRQLMIKSRWGCLALLTKEAFNGEVRASHPRSGYADQTSNYSNCGSKPPPYVEALQSRDQSAKEE